MDPLVSVIVPIYNVELYVRRCLDSLKNQTLKQIEVIMVDDGSTDQSGKIAEEYVSDDWPRFRIIHTENRGLSAARNRGMDEAIAEYRMFVDSDDWVESRFCEVPYKAAVENQADMVIFERLIAGENGDVKGGKKERQGNRSSIREINYKDAIDNGRVVVWNKIYRNELFESVLFPEGRVFEDLAVTHRLIYRAKKIVYIDEELIFHRERRESITGFVAPNSIRDYYQMSVDRCDELQNLGYSKKKIEALRCKDALWYYGRANDTNDMLYRKACSILKNCKISSSCFSLKNKMKLLLWNCNRKLYRRLYRAVIHMRVGQGRSMTIQKT